jgi:hypothetical protein
VTLIAARIAAHEGKTFAWPDVEAISRSVAPGGLTWRALRAHKEIDAAYQARKAKTRTSKRAPRTTDARLVDMTRRAVLAEAALDAARRRIVQYQINAQLLRIPPDALEAPLATARPEGSDVAESEAARLRRNKEIRLRAQAERRLRRTAKVT